MIWIVSLLIINLIEQSDFHIEDLNTHYVEYKSSLNDNENSNEYINKVSNHNTQNHIARLNKLPIISDDEDLAKEFGDEYSGDDDEDDDDDRFESGDYETNLPDSNGEGEDLKPVPEPGPGEWKKNY